MADRVLKRLRNEVAGTVDSDVTLAAYTTWNVGGCADWLVEPDSVTALETALTILHAEGIPRLVIGGGSNLLVKDGGFRGAVVVTRRLRDLEIGASGQVVAEAGTPLAEVIKKTLRAGLSGLEELAGIPGTIGGATVMNAGAGTTELGSMVREVLLHNGEKAMCWDHKRCGFGYRSSAISDDAVVTKVHLALTAGDPEQLQARYEERLAARQATHPYDFPNAGSVFKNPPGEAAWRLIDAAGLRGERQGQAQISLRHTNFIVNLGGATADDILGLIDLTRTRVREKFGIELEPEVKIVGDDA